MRKQTQEELERHDEMVRICKLLLQCYGYNMDKIRMYDRRKKIAHARIIVMLVLAMKGFGGSQIGRHFHRDHSTAQKNIEKAKDVMSVDQGYKAEVQALLGLL